MASLFCILSNSQARYFGNHSIATEFAACEGNIMRVHIEALVSKDRFRHALQNDGWNVIDETDNLLCLQHPSVPDEVAARNRLHELGFLTSRSLRIEFDGSQLTNC
jgi:hypothetical protein